MFPSILHPAFSARFLQEPPPAPLDPRELPERGDHQFSPDLAIDFPVETIKAAAVLVPIIARPVPTVLFTRRSSRLKNHSGQVAFPGGRIDETDKGALAAALRETEEEIGLDRAFVEPIGYLDLYQSTTGYRITPVVGIVTPPLNLILNHDEVEETFEVPLDFLMERKNHTIERREWKGRERAYVAITFERHYIWGVTAGILQNLREKVLT